MLSHHSHLMLSSLDDDVSSAITRGNPTPPIPFRDDESYILAGNVTAEAATESPKLCQSASSSHPLLNPPRPIPNPYGWMRDESRANRTVLDHLHAENEYREQMTRHLNETHEELYQEFLSSIHETDYTTPVAKGSFWYYSRYEEGVSYPRYCRAPRSSFELYPPPINLNWNQRTEDGTSLQPLLPGEEVYLDVPLLAQNKTYLAVGVIAVSPNEEYIAYSLDLTGRETCLLFIRNIATGEEWILYDTTSDERRVMEAEGSIVWNNDSTAIFYVTLDKTHRPYRVYYRKLFCSEGSYIALKLQSDELLLEERDGLFSVHISTTFDGKYLLVSSSSKESSEIHYLDLHDSQPDATTPLVCIAKRKPKALYRATHCNGWWLIQTKENTPNFRLKASRVGASSNMTNWKDVVLKSKGISLFDGGEQRSLGGITVFHPSSGHAEGPYAVATGREQGLPRVWILELNEATSSLAISKATRLEFDEPAFDVGIGGNRDDTLPYVVIAYDSLITPLSHIAIPLANPSDLDRRRVMKEEAVPGYDKSLYACERTTARSRDGKTEIPVSLVYRLDSLQKQSFGDGIPTHLYGYGSYGACIEASFRATRLPLLNRGIVYAIAHVRGGGEMGRPWYESAKYLCKRNSFDDFVDVARWLTCAIKSSDSSSVGEGITVPSKLSCEGRSAGGLLIGASINQAPELFKAAILGVPFVDVACTMCDQSLPLTITEWEEWGNPNEEYYFEYMMSYCPMQNVQREAVYPSCLITGGLYDPRVQYWEPAKFAGELRHSTSEESGVVLLKMDMEAGHFSASDRYKYLRELAFDYSFLLDELGLLIGTT
jgi:oligopeptidase B